MTSVFFISAITILCLPLSIHIILTLICLLLILINIIHSPDPTAETVVQIKFVAYGVIAYIIVGVGIVGNVLSLVVLTRPNLKVRQQF